MAKDSNDIKSQHVIHWVSSITKDNITLYVLVLVFMACVHLLSCSNCEKIHNIDELVGTWRGSKGSLEIEIKFDKDQSCEIKITEQGKRLARWRGNFIVDFWKKPIPLSVMNIGGLAHPLHTIIAFDGADKIKMAPFAPRKKLRPINFDPSSVIVLMRQ